jgi:flagellar biosynthesis/type III secretory pathway protein FliH
MVLAMKSIIKSMMGKAIKQIVLDAIQKTLEESQLQKENIYLQISLQQLELLKIKGLKFWDL